METANNTPLWLDLKKEYIDDNFDKLLVYLKKNACNDKDSFYHTTIELLCQRVEDLLISLSGKAIYEEEPNRANITFDVRLLASYLLALPLGDLNLPAFVALMDGLSLLAPKFAEQLSKTAMKRLGFENISSIGINWDDIRDFKPELFAHHIFNYAKFDNPLSKPLVYEKNGSAFITSDGICLTYENCDSGKELLRSGANSIETGNGCALRTMSSHKLKKSEENNLAAMDEYVEDFILSQRQCHKTIIGANLAEYNDGDTAIVRIFKIDGGTIHVETTDNKYQRMIGTIKFDRPSIMYYYTNSLYEYFSVGNFLTATITSIADRTFSIEKQLISFLVNDTKTNYGYEDVMPAKLIDIKPDYCGWINERGVAVYTKNDKQYTKNDLALLRVQHYCTGNYLGKINAEVDSAADSEDDFDEKTVRRDRIEEFAQSTQLPVEHTEENLAPLNSIVLKLLFRHFYNHQKTLLKPSERFRYLANARVMAEMVGDKLSSSYIKFSATYLRALVSFVQNEKLSDFRLETEDEYKLATPTLIRLSILELLKEYGKTESSSVLSRTIEGFKDSIPMLSRLARLIQTANSMQGILSSSAINVIRREIIKTLSLETENDADLEMESGVYLGVESGTVEFKTSIVYPANNNMQANQSKQTDNVFRAVCALLNSQTGGTVYLGVNDQGYVVGLDSDMKYLNCTSLETYARLYVQDPMIKRLGLDSMSYIKTERLYDDHVLAINVSPHPYRVVELDGVAYIRVNAESREMSENVKQEMIASKLFKDKNKAAAVSQLQHAMSQKKCAVLHGYSSSNSGTVADRLVEPYMVLPEDSLVICYDLQKHKRRIFNISRIGYVEVLDEEWKNSASHIPVAVDAFHMSGDNAIKVDLQLDLMAKNQLIEEFPRTKDDITQEQGDNNIWYLSTTVYAIQGIGRFYIGLANHIKILNAPELETYVTEFKERYL